MDRYPELTIRIDVEHEIVSPVAENYDIVFAMLEQPLPSTGIVIRKFRHWNAACMRRRRCWKNSASRTRSRSLPAFRC
jgi:DNA-binding transcriptional LysR family regulator